MMQVEIGAAREKQVNMVTSCYQEKCRRWLGLDADGALWLKKGEKAEPGKDADSGEYLTAEKTGADWNPVSFNENYAGYYPMCIFTAIAVTDVDFVAAGVAEDGQPYVYRSIMGGVWESANLMGGSKLGGFVRASGRVNQILYDSAGRQIFLLCANGELVTMPDCPKCVRVRKVTDCALTEGEVLVNDNEELQLVLLNARGEKLILDAYEMTQVRASFSYVKEALKQGGYLVDLRRQREQKADSGDAGQEAVLFDGIRKEQILRMEQDDIENWLEHVEKDTLIAFLCEYGTQADEAAHYVRRHHFPRAYSLGGAGELFHVE